MSLPVFLYGLEDYGVVNGDEAFYHYVARQMTRSGNWFQLVFDGEHRTYDTFMNAPWQYWARGLVILLLGDHYWSMRLLSAASGLLAVLMTYRLTCWLADRRAGLLAGLVQLTTMQFVHLHSARTGELDALLALLFAAAAYVFLRALETGRSFVPHHVCLALLLGIKLPVILMPLAAEAAFFVLSPRARSRWRDWASSALWVLPLGLVWHVAHAVLQCEDLRAVISRIGEDAAAGGEESLSGRLATNGLFYARVLVFGTYPWAVVYPFAIVSALRRGTREQREHWGLLLLFAAAVLAFFLLVGKRNSWYLLPAYPFLSALTGVWLARLLRERPRVALLLSASLIVTLVASIRVDMDFNPYLKNARQIPMDLSWRDFAGAPPGVSLVVVIAGLFVLLLGIDRSGRAGSRAIGGILLALLLTVAGWRTVRPLAFTDTQSEMERICRAMHESPASVRFPVRIHEHSDFRARFYFGDRHRIVRLGGARGIWYLLYRKDDVETPSGHAVPPGPGMGSSLPPCGVSKLP